jgi:hypothetical protein
MNSRRGQKHSSENSRPANRRAGRDELLLVRALFGCYPSGRVKDYSPGAESFLPWVICRIPVDQNVLRRS